MMEQQRKHRPKEAQSEMKKKIDTQNDVHTDSIGTINTERISIENKFFDISSSPGFTAIELNASPKKRTFSPLLFVHNFVPKYFKVLIN